MNKNRIAVLILSENGEITGSRNRQGKWQKLLDGINEKFGASNVEVFPTSIRLGIALRDNDYLATIIFAKDISDNFQSSNSIFLHAKIYANFRNAGNIIVAVFNLKQLKKMEEEADNDLPKGINIIQLKNIRGIIKAVKG